jgi:hypothetical protein
MFKTFHLSYQQKQRQKTVNLELLALTSHVSPYGATSATSLTPTYQ